MTNAVLRGLVLTLAATVGCTEPSAPSPAGSTGTSEGTQGEPTSSGASTTTTDTPTDATSADSTGADTEAPALPCNGHAALCDRPFDMVAFPGTHNSHAATDDGFPPVNANQIHGIADQLEAGIRVLLIDVYLDETDGDTVLMCHGPCGLASRPHLEGLTAITTFLTENPREIVTIIYEDHVAAEELAQDFATTGAEALTYVHPSGRPWPTLGAMIEADTRLVVTAESAGPPPDWLHHVWDEAWDTPYGPTAIEDLSCALGRGSPDNALFLMNHWVNDALGLPSQSNAEIVNASDVLLARALECQRMWDHVPNFVVVDFHEHGDLFAVVDVLNGVDAP